MNASAALPAVDAADRPIALPRKLRLALVGNPNCGKSTLFNALTGRNQRVANYPGVTVELVEGSYAHERDAVTVIDLPGIYSLAPDSPDEAIAHDVVMGRAAGIAPVDVLAIVIDAENIERHLFLATQVLELGLPTVVVLNRSDRLAKAGMSIDVIELMSALGAVVVPTVATTREGVAKLRHAIGQAMSLPRSWMADSRSGGAGGAGGTRGTRGTGGTGGTGGPGGTGGGIGRSESVDDEAATRYRWIASVMERTVSRRPRERARRSDKVDAVLLHGVWGPLIFLALMALAFQSLFTIAHPIADGIQDVLALAGTAIQRVLPAGDLRGLLVDGVIGGVGSVLVFVPQIALLFLFIGILEDSGYLARAAFVMDRYMRPLGLQGKSVIPLLSGYACAVPAILATRTIPQTKERLATVMVVPLMSCSARLPVYALLIAAFVPATTVAGVFTWQGVALLAMYLLGTGAALASAALFRRTILRSATRSLIIELPPYVVPSVRVLAATVWQRVAVFLRRAGTVIFAISVLLWALASYPRAGSNVSAETQLSQSALGQVGHVVEPSVRPLGLDWKIGVAMVASFAAREVFVSTMATMHGVAHDGESTGTLAARVREARREDGTARLTQAAAFGLMAFYVFALMCTSTMAVTVRETGGGWRGLGWASFQFGYMLLLAWGSAFVIYRAGLVLGFGGGA